MKDESYMIGWLSCLHVIIELKHDIIMNFDATMDRLIDDARKRTLSIITENKKGH